MGEFVMHRLFPIVCNMSLTASVVILAVLAVRLLLRRAPKVFSYALWAVVLFRLLCPVSVTSAVSLLGALGAPAQERSAVTSVVEYVPADIVRNMAPAVTPLPQEPFPAEPGENIISAAPSVTQPDAAPASPLSGPVAVLTLTWLMGIALLLLYSVISLLRLRRRLVGAVRLEDNIYLADYIPSPFVMGLFRPKIYLPSTLTETERGYILRHEQYHLRRRDHVVKLLSFLALCVHWFNPLVWVMYVLANRDLELSCDETVLRRFGGDVRAAYARVLIRMEAARGGFAPLCNHFGKNAIEERITAIMKTKRITIVSLGLAALLVAGTVTVFATSAQGGTSGTPVKASSAFAEENAAFAGSGGTAVESGVPLQPDTDYTAAGISSKGRLWYYAGQPVAMIYDDNDSIYMDEEAAGGCYLHVRRDSAGVISGVDVLTKEQFRELADRRMNAASDTTYEESTLMSYVDPADGRTYYSFDGGKTFEPLTDAEFEARFPTPDVVWWTYDEYKAWLDNEKVELQSLLGQTSGDYTWTQQKIDETIALYESILKDIQNGVLYSKTVDGSDDVMLSMNPADIAQTAG